MLGPYSFEIILSGSIVLAHLILRWILVAVVKRFARKSEKVEHRTGLIIKYIDFAVIFGIVLSLILIWGVQFQDVGVVLSSVFAVIGVALFASWSILSNVTSGVIMFFTFPYKIGDYIIIHDKEYDYQGIIEDIKGFHVLLKTPDNRLITYPNSLMLQKGVSVIKPEEVEEYLNEEDKNLSNHTTD
ncbi:MAG: mechanosensitive ion channel protein MscS [Alteromonas sp.]|nr:mechanosensitive ion channel protein MscS [Alteromonas sp.]MAY22195.1 mechanosensitive ion channel protein MscS [Flavobacteriaceae bacterium]|tara:strand:- start:79537 stop:80094 length:558 start_codon:yes stop_codon:yes gene_type:complete